MSAELGRRVKARREALGLSMRALPGVDVAQVSRIESGKLADPAFSTVRGLAKGLGMTLDELDGAPASAVRMIALRDIEADPANPRTVDVAHQVDADFVASIRERGLLQAITVRAGEGTAWRVAYGGRRHAALCLIHGPRSAHLVPCKLTDLSAGPELLLNQLVENIKRADMNPADLALAVTRLVDGNMDTQTLATALGKGRRWVQEQASVGHHLTPASQGALRAGTLTISQAIALAAERDADRQNDLAARAAIQGLGEEEIRAIVAEAKALEEKTKAAAEAERQPALLDEGTPVDSYHKANVNGVFGGTPTRRLRWKGRRGFFAVDLFQFGKEKWSAGYSHEWRAGSVDGGSSNATGARDRYAGPTPALAFVACALDNYSSMAARARRHPEDGPAMRELHAWITAQIGKLGGSPRMEAEWSNNRLAPQPPAKQPKKKKAAPKVRELTKADVVKLPAWAKPLKFAYFVVLSESSASLVKSWKAMATLMWQIHGTDQHTLRTLLDRMHWANDTTGKPFDFGGIVLRVTHVKARP